MTVRTHFVYEAYDADLICLYVGCTGNPAQRYQQHMSGKEDARGWFDRYVVSWRVSGPYPKRVALDIEKQRIRDYQPIFNGHSTGNANGSRALIAAYLEQVAA